MKPKFSIIIPVYNSEKYLLRTIKSIQNQTLSDWELILVNDGSTDSSLNIICEFANEDSRIKVINQKNLGPACARNSGLNIAIGKYICFVDSDDYIEPNMLQSMYEEAEKHKANIVMCNFALICNGNRKVLNHNIVSHCLLSKLQIYEELISKLFIGGDKCAGIPCLWAKIYEREWIIKNNLKIPENRIRSEDWFFNISCFILEPKMCVIDKVLYNYCQNEGSIMHTIRDGEWKQFIEDIRFMLQLNREKGMRYEEQLFEQLIFLLVDQLFLIYSKSPINKKLAFEIMHDSTLNYAIKRCKISKTYKALYIIIMLLKYRLYFIVHVLLYIIVKRKG